MKAYFVEYNCKFIAMYKRLINALKFIERKGLRNDYDNVLRIFDNEGNQFDPITGREVNY